jgi:hypothetical protein
LSLGRFDQIGYRTRFEHKTLITLPYFWLHTENQIQTSGDFQISFFPQFMAIENKPKHFIMQKIKIKNFSDILPKKNAAGN